MAIVKIEISPYLKQFLIDKYGPEPISFPQNCMFMRHITEGCAPPPIIRKILIEKFHPEDAESEKMADSCWPGLETHSCSVRKEDSLLEVILPKTVFRCGRIIETNNSWRLNYDSCRSFRKTADSMFWIDLNVYVDDYMRARKANGEFYSRRSAILEFMSFHQIDSDALEAILRQDVRRRKNLLNNKKTEENGKKYAMA